MALAREPLQPDGPPDLGAGIPAALSGGFLYGVRDGYLPQGARPAPVLEHRALVLDPAGPAPREDQLAARLGFHAAHRDSLRSNLVRRRVRPERASILEGQGSFEAGENSKASYRRMCRYVLGSSLQRASRAGWQKTAEMFEKCFFLSRKLEVEDCSFTSVLDSL